MLYTTDSWWPAPPLRPHGQDVQVCWIEIPRWRPHVAMLREFLSPDERVRANRFRLEADVDRLIIGRGMLRLLIGRLLHLRPEQVAFVYSTTGKPSVRGIEFNVAHSANVVLIATHQQPVGVDVERVDRLLDVGAIAGACFTERESRLILEDAVPQQAFCRLWTRKEAWLKAVGIGLSFRLRDIDVADAAAPSIASHAVVQGPRPSRIIDLPAEPGYCAACAVSGPDCRVRLSRL